MKTFIASLNDYQKNLSDLCNEIGKKYLNGEKVDLTNNIWYVKTRSGIKKMKFRSHYDNWSKGRAVIAMELRLDNLIKNVFISMCDGKVEEGSYELPRIKYEIDNMSYETTVCEDQMKVEKQEIF